MKLINSELSHRIIESHKIEIGELHFLKNIIITEFDEGIHLDIKTAKEYLELINAFYNSNKPFAIISNRIHSYSISPLDSDKFKNELKNLAAYGVVSYNRASKMHAKIENTFCKSNDICFESLYDAVNWIEIKLSLNEYA